MNKNFDVIIAGAGPAGLSLASVLSQKHKVCIIDKNKIGTTTKSWASFKDLIKNLGLEKAIFNNKIEILEFSHYLGAKWIFKDIYCQLDEQKLLDIFIKRCNKKNINFISNFELKDFCRFDGKIQISNNKNKFNAKILIDCTGADSPIIKKYDLISKYSSYPILGFNVKNVDVDPKKFIWEIMKTPNYNELMIGGIMPYSKGYAQVHIFPYLKQSRVSYDFLESFLKDYFTYYPGLKNAKIISRSKGTILMGELKKNALDNIIFFGESALWTPRFIGTGFNQILRDYIHVANKISNLIITNRLSEKYLSQIKSLLQNKKTLHFLNCFEKIIFSLKNYPEKLNEFLIKINQADPCFGKCLMRNEFNLNVLKKSWKKIHEHFSIYEISQILSKKDILYLLEVGFELLEDSILEKYRLHLKEL